MDFNFIIILKYQYERIIQPIWCENFHQKYLRPQIWGPLKPGHHFSTRPYESSFYSNFEGMEILLGVNLWRYESPGSPKKQIFVTMAFELIHIFSSHVILHTILNNFGIIFNQSASLWLSNFEHEKTDFLNENGGLELL